MLKKVLSFVLLMSLAFAGVSCSDSDDSSEGGNGAGNGSGGGGSSSSYAGWWYYDDNYLASTRRLVLLSEDGSVLRAGTLDSSSGDGVELSGDDLEDAKTKYSYKNESARAYLKKFADSGLSKLSYWCTVDSTKPFTWGIECIKKAFQDEYNGCEVEQKPDGSYNISVSLSGSYGHYFMIDDTLRGYRGSYATVKPEIDYISTAVDSYYRDTLFYIEDLTQSLSQKIYSSEWGTYNLDSFSYGRLENRKYSLHLDGGKLGTGTAIIKLTFSHPKASKDLIVWIEFKKTTSSQQ